MLRLGIIGVGGMGSSHFMHVMKGLCPDVVITAAADGAVAAFYTEEYLIKE